jgi:hypothetical protein
VVNVANRPDVHVGLGALEFLFCHVSIPMRCAQTVLQVEATNLRAFRLPMTLVSAQRARRKPESRNCRRCAPIKNPLNKRRPQNWS